MSTYTPEVTVCTYENSKFLVPCFLFSKIGMCDDSGEHVWVCDEGTKTWKEPEHCKEKVDIPSQMPGPQR